MTLLDDRILQLAFGMQYRKGSYALLLGSGVSRAANMPTGWEVMADLIQQIASAETNLESFDLIKWYEQRFGERPRYDTLLGKIAPDQANQQAILRHYFEATEDERAVGEKTPTKAHRAIAELARDGLVKIIITTNFDRLLETAMRDIGVEPTILSSDGAIQNTFPIIHSPVPVVVKLHGDYLDSPLKNLPEELISYPAQTEHLLDLIFDQFNLLVCGWSAYWDKALCGAIERAKRPSFTVYWADHQGQYSSGNEKPLAVKSLQLIAVESADALFNDLYESIKGIERSQKYPPLSASIFVERIKRYIHRPEEQIRMEEMIRDEAVEAQSLFEHPQQKENARPLLNDRNVPNPYVPLIEKSLRSLFIICAYGNLTHIVLVRDVLLSWTARPLNSDLQLELWPSFLLLYACGVATIQKQNWQHLSALLLQIDVPNGWENAPVPATEFILDNFIHTYKRDYLQHTLIEILGNLFKTNFPQEHDRKDILSVFDFILCLVRKQRYPEKPVKGLKFASFFIESDTYLRTFCKHHLTALVGRDMLFHNRTSLLDALKAVQGDLNETRKLFAELSPFSSFPSFPDLYEDFVQAHTIKAETQRYT